MTSPKEALISSLHDALVMHGVQSARIVVQLLPEHQGDSGVGSTPASQLNIVVSDGNARQLQLEGEPVEKALAVSPRQPTLSGQNTNQATASPTPSGTTTPQRRGGSINVNDNDTKATLEQGVGKEMEGGNLVDCLSSTARPGDVMRKHLDATSQLFEEVDDTDATNEILRQFVGRSSILENKREREKAKAASIPYLPTATTMNQASVSSAKRDSKITPKMSTLATSFAGHNTSAVLVEEREELDGPLKNGTSGGFNHPDGAVSSRGSISTTPVISPHVQPKQHILPHEVGDEPKREATLVSSSTLPQVRHADGNHRGSCTGSDTKKLPPVRRGIVGSTGTGGGEAGGCGKSERLAPPPTEAREISSKQRLQELLQDQRAMEQQSMLSRAHHEELVREAEKYLQGLQQARAAEAAGSDSVLPPVVGSQNPPSCGQPPVPTSPHSSTPKSVNAIKVVKFTMPAGEKAKDEVVAQLSTSHGGSQHLSSKDKLAMLLREQQKILCDKEVSEQEYQKLLQQAIAYHDEKKRLKQMRKQEQEL